MEQYNKQSNNSQPKDRQSSLASTLNLRIADLNQIQTSSKNSDDEQRAVRSPMILPDILETPEDDERGRGFRVFLQRKFYGQV